MVLLSHQNSLPTLSLHVKPEKVKKRINVLDIMYVYVHIEFYGLWWKLYYWQAATRNS